MENGLVNVGEELIVIKQLPIIEDKLDEALEAVRDRLNATSNLAVTEDNYKELKKIRADLNKEFAELERLRKRVKEALEAPIRNFEQGAYKRISDEYRKAIEQLDGNIKSVEGGLKNQRQAEVLGYFDSYRTSLGIDSSLVSLDKAGIKVGLSGTIKSLKGQAKEFLDQVDSDLKAIDMLDNRDEVLLAYRDLLNVSDAVRVVTEHHRRVEEEKKRREAMEAARLERIEAEAAVDAALSESSEIDAEVALWQEGDVLHAPTVQNVTEGTESGKNGNSDSVVYSASFCVYGTLSQLKELKKFLVDGNYKFETLKGDK